MSVWKTIEWTNVTDANRTTQYACGWCGSIVGPTKGYSATWRDSHGAEKRGGIWICPVCTNPVFEGPKGSYPSARPGRDVDVDAEGVQALYNEARQCCGESCYVGSVLCSRKLLMHIAVAKGAEEGLRFIKYVEYLDAQHFVPPGGKDWVDHIRTKGNEATHEIVEVAEEDARELIEFLEMLLMFIYEFPQKMAKKTQGP